MRSQPGTLSASLGDSDNGAPGTCRTRWCSSLLGRLPPGGLATGNTTVQLLDGDTGCMDTRRTQIDMRFAKILRFGGRAPTVGVDLYNLLNSNYATVYESHYSYTQPNGGTWLNPTSILPPRFARFNVTFSF